MAAESAQRGYLLTHRAAFVDPYQSSRRTADTDFLKLARALRHEPTHVTAIAELKSSLDQKFAEMDATVDAERRGDSDTAMALTQLDIGVSAMATFQTRLAHMEADENAELLQWRDAFQKRTFQDNIGTALSTVLLACALALLVRMSARAKP